MRRAWRPALALLAAAAIAGGLAMQRRGEPVQLAEGEGFAIHDAKGRLAPWRGEFDPRLDLGDELSLPASGAPAEEFALSMRTRGSGIVHVLLDAAGAVDLHVDLGLIAEWGAHQARVSTDWRGRPFELRCRLARGELFVGIDGAPVLHGPCAAAAIGDVRVRVEGTELELLRAERVTRGARVTEAPRTRYVEFDRPDPEVPSSLPLLLIGAGALLAGALAIRGGTPLWAALLPCLAVLPFLPWSRPEMVIGTLIVSAVDVERPEPLRLDAGNALLPAGQRFMTDLDLSLRVTAHAGGTLGIRMHSPTPESGEGVILQVGADPRMRTRFVRVSGGRIEPIGSENYSGLPEQEYEVRVEVRGERWRAFVVDLAETPAERERMATQPAAEAVDEERRYGAIALTALHGEVVIRDLRLSGPDGSWSEEWDGSANARTAASGAACIAFALANLAALPLAAPLLLPGAWVAGEPTLLEQVVFSSLAFAAVALALVLAGRSRRPNLRRLAVAVTGANALFAVLFMPGALLRRPAALAPGLEGYTARHLEHDLLHLQHEALRAGNTYLALHQLHGEEATAPRTGNALRVLVLGGSSSAGAEPMADRLFPARLEDLMRLQFPGRPVEVFNAAWRGATLEAQLAFLDGVLLAGDHEPRSSSARPHDFDPDAIVLVPSPMEMAATAVADAPHWLDAASSHDSWRTLPQRLMQELAFERGATRRDPARFRELVERLVARVERRGCALCLVAPFFDGRPALGPTADERSALESVAREHRVPVVSLDAAREGYEPLFHDDVLLAPRGHARLAEALARVLVPELRERRPR